MAIWGGWNPLSAYTDIYENLATGLYDGISGKGAEKANNASQASAQNAMNFAQSSADKQMDFQERMSNTAYQRGMKDMEAAGLNPMLAFMKGGASSPSGASAQGSSSTYQDTGAAAVKGTSSIASTATGGMVDFASVGQMGAQAQASSAQAAQTQAMTPVMLAKAESETLLNSAQAAKSLSDTDTNPVIRKKYEQEIKNLIDSNKINQIDGETKRRLLEWQKKNDKLYRTKNTLDSINPLKGMFGQ